MTHEWQDRLDDGLQGEAFLDRFFSRWHDIELVSMAEQRLGLDRRFVDKETGDRVGIEYKTDHRAFETGNAFVETVSVDTNGRRGWAYTSRADCLMYYLPEGGLIYMLPMTVLREQLPRWVRQYPKRPAQNREYKTWGLCVPLREFEKYAQVINLAEWEA